MVLRDIEKKTMTTEHILVNVSYDYNDTFERKFVRESIYTYLHSLNQDGLGLRVYTKYTEENAFFDITVEAEYLESIKSKVESFLSEGSEFLQKLKKQ